MRQCQYHDNNMGEFFDATGSPFHEYMERCMEQKRLRGVSQREMNRELQECAEAWANVTDRIEPEDIDEEALARQVLGVD